MDALQRYYRAPAIRRRILEYLGGAPGVGPTALFVCDPVPTRERPFAPRPVGAVWSLLDERLEAARSLWDRESLIAHLDIEHVHFDRPWQPLADRERCYGLQRPLVDALRGLLAEHGIAPLHLLTGRGHHLVWRIARDSRSFRALVCLGRPNDGLRRQGRVARWPSGEAVGETLGAAQHALGKLLEHVAQQALLRARSATVIPLQLAAVCPVPGHLGREVIAIDLSVFGDPLSVRSIRLPFTAYRKAGLLGAPAEIVDRTVLVMPVIEGDVATSVAAMVDPARAAELADAVSVAIPAHERGTLDLVDAYLASELRRFHDAFESEPAVPTDRWPETYDAFDLATVQSCVRRILELPNDLLLQPAAIQLTVRVLSAQGWSARRIAGLVESKLARDHGWIAGLHFHEPGVRAEFYVRLFAGMIALGFDTQTDLDCASTREKWLCPGSDCGWELADLAPRRGGTGG